MTEISESRKHARRDIRFVILAATLVGGVLVGVPCVILFSGVVFWVGFAGLFIAAQYFLIFPVWKALLNLRAKL